MKVADWIKQNPRDPETISPESQLEEIAECMLSTPCQRDIYVINTEGKLIGHINRHRLASLLLADYRSEHTRRQLIEQVVSGTAEDIMETHFLIATADEELEKVLQRQQDHDVEDMPVIDKDGMTLGVINLTQVLQIFLKEAENRK